jgi:hypothetical protein
VVLNARLIRIVLTIWAARRIVVSKDDGSGVRSEHPTRNLHFIMGNMAKLQWQFIVIGLLRSGLDPQELAKQGSLF